MRKAQHSQSEEQPEGKGSSPKRQTQMDLRCIQPSESMPSAKALYCMFPTLCQPGESKTIETGTRSVVASGWEGEGAVNWTSTEYF